MMKILYVTTVSGTINTFLIPHIKELIKLGHKVDIASNTTIPINSELIDLGCDFFDVGFSRSPLKKDNIKAFVVLKKILELGEYDIVHTHTPIASTIVRLICRKIDKVKVIYTAHGFHFHQGAPIINWLIYFPIEYYLSKYTDVLITINKEDYTRAKKFFRAANIKYVPGVGFDTENYTKMTISKNLKRGELGIPKGASAILSVGELNKNKNHETVIRALSKLKNEKLYYLICGVGPLNRELLDLSIKLGIENQVKLLGYREDVNEIYKAVDLFVFPSKREGLPVALMEAMASGLPIICSNIRGNNDLVEDKKNGFLINPNDVNEFAEKISIIISGYENNMGVTNQKIIKKYDTEIIVKKVIGIYSNI